MSEPALVPTIMAMGIFCSARTRITPTCANPRAAPPPRTRAILGSRAGLSEAARGPAGGVRRPAQEHAMRAARTASAAARPGPRDRLEKLAVILGPDDSTAALQSARRGLGAAMRRPPVCRLEADRVGSRA